MTLIVCPTPIGNLDDTTPRQRRALEEADLVACEDTRRCGKLMERLGIERADGTPRLVSYHDHNAEEMAERLVDQMRQGAMVTLVTDAGTPGVSDPGFELVRKARRANVEVTALPGPAAAVVALSASGLPTDAFQFRGFVPSGEERREAFIREVDGAGMTAVFYESPKRTIETLKCVRDVCGSHREVCVARELTKVHEEFVVGSVDEVLGELEQRDELKGEIVIVVAPSLEEDDERDRYIDRLIDQLIEQGMSPRGIKDVVAETFEISRSGLYERIDRRRESLDQN